FFFQAEDGIRDFHVTGVQTCALPIWKEDLLLYINENEGEIYFEDEVDNVKIKGVKFYTMNDTRETIKQIGEIALKNGFKGLSFRSEERRVGKKWRRGWWERGEARKGE